MIGSGHGWGEVGKYVGGVRKCVGGMRNKVR